MKKITKIILATLIAIFAITLTNSVQANYQVIYRSSISDYQIGNGHTIINAMRNMEASGQVMGLTETHNGSSLLSTSGSNYIDVHMEKNTEYGAMVLLSASTKYGKQGTGTARYVGTGTTTGNVYGVYMNNTTEITAAEWKTGSNSNNTRYSDNINTKYLDIYYSTSARLNGDAQLKWHGNTVVSYSGDMIPYRGYNSNIYYISNESAKSGYRRARPVVVCGEGF